MRRGKTWKQLQDEIIIREAELKKQKEDHKWSPLAENLKKEGNIKEAAAVFSYEGFQWFINSIENLVASKIEPLIDRKISEILDGLKEGIEKAVAESSKAVIENIIAKKVEEKLNFGTSEDEVEQVKGFEENPFVNAHNYTDFSAYDGVVAEKAEEKFEEEKQTNKKGYLIEELPTTTYTGVKIPRNHRGIWWSQLNEEEQRQVFLHYIGMAKEVGADISGSQFRKFHPDANAVYQRIHKIYGAGGFDKLKKEYEEKYSYELQA